MKYHDPSFLVKYLYNASLTKNEKILNEANDALIDLKNSINRREIPKNENPDKVIDIVEKIFNFHKQQKGNGLKILTSKEMLQRLLIALAPGRAGKASENLLNEVRQVKYSLH